MQDAGYDFWARLDVPTLDWMKILRRDPCAYCGSLAGGVDHLIPWKLNPDLDVPENMTAACNSCNGTKGDRLGIAQTVAYGRLFKRHPVSTFRDKTRRARMTTFKIDADFQHPTATVEPNRTGSAGVHIKFPNEWCVSVQWGPGTYSDNHQDFTIESWHDSTLTSEHAEIAAWRGDTGMIEWSDGDTVQGWKTWDEVQAVLDQAEAGTLATVSADA